MEKCDRCGEFFEKVHQIGFLGERGYTGVYNFCNSCCIKEIQSWHDVEECPVDSREDLTNVDLESQKALKGPSCVEVGDFKVKI